MAVTLQTPPQIPSDNSGNFTTVTTHTAGVQHGTITHTIPKLTSSGAAGSVTFVDGKVTVYTPPT